MSRSLLALAVSVSVSAIVLGVFATHQWHGPVGTLQRYLRAAMDGDASTMQRLEYPPAAGFRSQLLAGYRGARNIHIRSVRRVGDNLVWIVTEIVHPRYRQIVVVVVSWVMVERPEGWKVDIRRTLQVNAIEPF